MKSFFGIKIKRKQKASKATATTDKTPINVTANKAKSSPPVAISIQQKPTAPALKKPLFSIRRKENATSLQKKPEKNDVKPAPQKDANAPNLPTTNQPINNEKAKAYDPADLHALAKAMGVSVEPIKHPAPAVQQKIVPPPKEKDEQNMFIQKPTPLKKKATRKTKHDKIVEELAKSLGKSMTAKTATKTKTKSSTSKNITIKKPKRQR